MDTLSFRTAELMKLREALEPLICCACPSASCPAPETIWAAIAGNLGSEDTQRVVEHIGSCLACVEAWEVAEDMQMILEEPNEPLRKDLEIH